MCADTRMTDWVRDWKTTDDRKAATYSGPNSVIASGWTIFYPSSFKSFTNISIETHYISTFHYTSCLKNSYELRKLTQPLTTNL